MWLLKYLLFEDFFYIMLNDDYNCFYWWMVDNLLMDSLVFVNK